MYNMIKKCRLAVIWTIVISVVYFAGTEALAKEMESYSVYGSDLSLSSSGEEVVIGKYRCVIKEKGVSIVGYNGTKTQLEIPERLGDYQVVEIEAEAFWGSNLKSIKLPSGVTKISRAAFGNCEKLKNIELPSEITEIGEGAFTNCTT